MLENTVLKKSRLADVELSNMVIRTLKVIFALAGNSDNKKIKNCLMLSNCAKLSY